MMAAFEGSKRPQASTTLPPRKINVKKFMESRGPELEALHSIVANRLSNNFRSRRNKRRRTTAYDNQVARKRCRKRQKLGGEVDKGNALDEDKEKKVSRRVRRRVELRMNPENGFVTSEDGTKRLRTHVWHAKRFTMKKLWGFYLPLGLQGRGRGSRALLKWFKHEVLVHDASYHVAVQLEGLEDSLMSVLKMLHYVGAPVSQLIAPVTYMWRPVLQQNRDSDAMDHDGDGCNKPESIECSSSFRQLWVWIHISALSEGFDALKFACQKEMDERGCLVNCFSREGQLAKLEVLGSKAFQHLQRILNPVTCSSENSWQLKRHSAAVSDNDSQFKRCAVLENGEDFCTNAILSLRVKDPRIMPETGIVDVPESLSTGMLNVPEAEIKGHAALTGVSDNKEVP